MTSARDRDLERWEQGELSMAELVELHGNDGAAGLVVLHRSMRALGTGPVGDPEPVWRAIRERLPDLAGHRRPVPVRRRLTRPLAIAAAAVLIAGTAYAGSTDTVQRYLTSFWHTVQSILDVDIAGSAPADADRPSQSGGQGDGPARAVDDAGQRERGDQTNEDKEVPEETSEGLDDADGDDVEGDDENGSGGEEEGVGGDDEGDDDGDDGEESSDDEADESDDDDEPDDEDDAPEGDGEDPENEDGPDGSGGGEDEGD